MNEKDSNIDEMIEVLEAVKRNDMEFIKNKNIFIVMVDSQIENLKLGTGAMIGKSVHLADGLRHILDGKDDPTIKLIKNFLFEAIHESEDGLEDFRSFLDHKKRKFEMESFTELGVDMLTTLSEQTAKEMKESGHSKEEVKKIMLEGFPDGIVDETVKEKMIKSIEGVIDQIYDN